jgi:hypothetical protein
MGKYGISKIETVDDGWVERFELSIEFAEAYQKRSHMSLNEFRCTSEYIKSCIAWGERELDAIEDSIIDQLVKERSARRHDGDLR